MTEDIVHGDFETRSVVNLKDFGLDVYAKHPTTDVLCFCYAFNDEPVETWRPGDPIPERLLNHIKKGGMFCGHNVIFEWYIWNFVMKPRYGWPTFRLSQLVCTMARAYAMAFPGSLAKLGKALGLVTEKDTEGHKLMLKMCKPRKIDPISGEITWWEKPDQIERLVQYCVTDVETEREADGMLLPLSEIEHALWLLDLRINIRGVAVDKKAIKKTQRMVDKVRIQLNREMIMATGGQIKKVSEAKRLLAWCKAFAIDIDSLKKSDMKRLLEEPDLPYEVREALEIRSKSAKISVSKLETMERMSVVDGRIRGMFQFHGASTGRWAGRGVQLHNLPRPEEAWEDPALQDRILTGIVEGTIDAEYVEEWYGPFMRVISSCIRAYIVAAPGKKFIGADFSNIEGVSLAWLAGEDWKLDMYRKYFWENGPDSYDVAAQRIFETGATDKPIRKIGKVSDLSMGYQGGVGAFQQMAVNYMVEVEDKHAEAIKVAWRSAHTNIVQFWHDVEKAALLACKNPGGKYYAGAKGRQICYRVVSNYLLCQLPSKRCLVYPFPQIEEKETSWGAMKSQVTFMTIDSRPKSKSKGMWMRMSSYGGKFVENITQAVARDILAEAMPRLEAAGYPIVLHVHDEVIAEVDEDFGSLEEFESIMSQLPEWATGLPIRAKGFVGRRFRK